MTKSPGHQKWPEHEVREVPIGERVRVEIDGEIVADSKDVIRLEEDDHPTRFYFPRSDVSMDRLERTDTTSECPFKGTAHYFSVVADGRTLEDAVWTYEEPFDEHVGLANRVAFYEESAPEIRIHVGATQEKPRAR